MAIRDDLAVIAPEHRVGFLIYRAGLVVARAYEKQMRPSGLIPGEVGALTHIASHGAGHIREIGRALGVSPQTVVNLARRLEARAMVVRTGGTSDRRTVVLNITDRGREALSQADAIASRFDQEIESILGEDALATARCLRKLLDEQDSWIDASAARAD